VSAHQAVHTFIVHDEHHEIGALAADLRSPADTGNFEWSRSAPATGTRLAGRDALAVLAADDEGSLDQR
jgi:hypothetical protein